MALTGCGDSRRDAGSIGSFVAFLAFAFSPKVLTETSLMNVTQQRLADLIIVDARPADYDRLIDDPQSRPLAIRCYATAEAALRTTAADSSTLWMINTHLPDLSGVELLSEIARRFRKPSVYLVGDAYSPHEEQAARAAGATFYVCKPASFAWLRGYHPRCRSPAIRAGPNLCPAAEHS